MHVILVFVLFVQTWTCLPLKLTGVVLHVCLFLFPFRFFNDAINCFSGDGWSLLKYDPVDNLILSVNKSKRIGVGSSFSSSSSLFGGVFCVNVSILLQVSCNLIILIKHLQYHVLHLLQI